MKEQDVIRTPEDQVNCFQYTSPVDRIQGESRDCTVRALTTALSLPYPKVHYALAHRGRRKGREANLNLILKHKFLGYKIEKIRGAYLFLITNDIQAIVL